MRALFFDANNSRFGSTIEKIRATLEAPVRVSRRLACIEGGEGGGDRQDGVWAGVEKLGRRVHDDVWGYCRPRREVIVLGWT